MSEAEFEDCLDIGLYVDQIFEKYGVPLKCFRSSLKWSERVKNAFSRCGKPWNKEIEDEIKELVADSVVADPMDALDDHKRSSIDALVKQLEDLIK
jgi:hypothetical protein